LGKVNQYGTNGSSWVEQRELTTFGWQQGTSALSISTDDALHSGDFATYDAYAKLTDDFNGDGRADLAAVHTGTGGILAYTALGKSDGTFQPIIPSGGNHSLHNGNFATYDAYSKLSGDFDGNGRADLAVVYTGPAGMWAYSALSKGDGTFYDAVGGPGPLHSGDFGPYHLYSKLTGDFNGDGRTDLAAVFTGGQGMFAYTCQVFFQ
jgi:hypothetical protein